MRGMRGARDASRSGGGGMNVFGVTASGGTKSAGASNKDGFIGIGRIETSSFAVGRSAAATAAWAADSTAAVLAVATAGIGCGAG